MGEQGNITEPGWRRQEGLYWTSLSSWITEASLEYKVGKWRHYNCLSLFRHTIAIMALHGLKKKLEAVAWLCETDVRDLYTYCEKVMTAEGRSCRLLFGICFRAMK